MKNQKEDKCQHIGLPYCSVECGFVLCVSVCARAYLQGLSALVPVHLSRDARVTEIPCGSPATLSYFTAPCLLSWGSCLLLHLEHLSTLFCQANACAVFKSRVILLFCEAFAWGHSVVPRWERRQSRTHRQGPASFSAHPTNAGGPHASTPFFLICPSFLDIVTASHGLYYHLPYNNSQISISNSKSSPQFWTAAHLHLYVAWRTHPEHAYTCIHCFPLPTHFHTQPSIPKVSLNDATHHPPNYRAPPHQTHAVTYNSSHSSPLTASKSLNCDHLFRKCLSVHSFPFHVWAVGGVHLSPGSSWLQAPWGQRTGMFVHVEFSILPGPQRVFNEYSLNECMDGEWTTTDCNSLSDLFAVSLHTSVHSSPLLILLTLSS